MHWTGGAGDGALVSGTAISLLSAAFGRPAPLQDVTGPDGRAQLLARFAARDGVSATLRHRLPATRRWAASEAGRRFPDKGTTRSRRQPRTAPPPSPMPSRRREGHADPPAAQVWGGAHRMAIRGARLHHPDAPRTQSRACSIAWSGRDSSGLARSKRSSTWSAHAAAHKTNRRWIDIGQGPAAAEGTRRGSRTLERITVGPPVPSIVDLRCRWANPAAPRTDRSLAYRSAHILLRTPSSAPVPSAATC